MAHSTQCFAKLKSLTINEPGPYVDTIIPDQFLIPEDECHALLTEQIECAGELRPTLCRVTYGIRTWTRPSYDSAWTMNLADTVPYPSIYEVNPMLGSGKLVYYLPRRSKRKK